MFEVSKIGFHKGLGRVSALQALLTANQNFAPVDVSKPRRKLSLQESMARSKARYPKTLKFLAER